MSIINTNNSITPNNQVIENSNCNRLIFKKIWQVIAPVFCCYQQQPQTSVSHTYSSDEDSEYASCHSSGDSIYESCDSTEFDEEYHSCESESEIIENNSADQTSPMPLISTLQFPSMTVSEKSPEIELGPYERLKIDLACSVIVKNSKVEEKFFANYIIDNLLEINSDTLIEHKDGVYTISYPQAKTLVFKSLPESMWSRIPSSMHTIVRKTLLGIQLQQPKVLKMQISRFKDGFSIKFIEKAFSIVNTWVLKGGLESIKIYDQGTNADHICLHVSHNIPGVKGNEIQMSAQDFTDIVDINL